MHSTVWHTSLSKVLVSLSITAVLFGTTACEDDDGSANVGDNDPNLVVCIGDSITHGMGMGGASYPSRLAQMTGKSVINAGVGGQRAAGGAARINGLLAQHPGYVCILFGANDAIHGGSPYVVKENLRAIVAACKANQSYPILATLTPMTEGHAMYDPAVQAISAEIRALAGEEHCALVDLYGSMSGHPEYLADGLHMSDAGNDRLAGAFKGRL
jgi:lysophospholipase L1-like esterase